MADRTSCDRRLHFGRRVKTRRAVAVLLSRFPLVTETFILREIDEMERQGQPVRLVPLLRERPAVIHREAVRWVPRALYTPYLSPRIAAANARTLRRQPGRYLGLLLRVLAGNAASPNFLFRALALFPKSVYLAERLRDEGVGHLHAHFATHPALAAYVISSLTGIPYSITLHAHDLFVRRTFLREKIRAASFVRSVSRFGHDLLSKLYPRETQDKASVIHVGVDPRGDDSSAPPAPGRVVCVAALKPYKGLPVLLAACARLKAEGQKLHCDVIGEGPLRSALERQIEDEALGDVVALLGAREQAEVAACLREAALVVLPSVVAADGQMEGIPVSLMEAMSARRPVVATSISGIPELVDDGASGLLVPPGDVAALADAMARLLRDPALARQMGERGREAIEDAFRLDTTVSALLAAIERFCMPVPPELAFRLARALPDEPIVGVRSASERRDSSVAELLVSDGRTSRERVLKRQPVPQARREREALVRVRRALESQEGLRVPEVRCWDEAQGLLLMDRCRGRSLKALAREARGVREPRIQEDLTAALFRTGRWLRALERGTSREASGGDALSALVGRAERDLAACAARVPGKAAHVRERLRHLASTLSPSRVVGRHGDFWPGNVFVDDDGVEVIDFEGFAEGLPGEDAAYFLVQLELFYSYPLVRAQWPRLEQAFLDGYGETLEGAVWELLRMAKVLHVLAQSLREQRHRGWRGFWRRRSLERMLREPQAAAERARA